MKRITELTAKQREKLKTWSEEWVKIGLSTERANWPRFEVAARKCYEYAQLNPNVPIIHVSSPIVGALAAPIAAMALALLQGKAVNSAVRSAVDSAVDSAVNSAVYSAVDSAVRSAVDSAVDSAVRSAVNSAVDSAVDSAVYSAVRSAAYSAVNSAVYSAVRSAVDSAVYSAVYSAVDSAVYSAVYSAVDSAVDSAVYSAVRSAVDSAVRSAVDSAVYSAVDSAVYSAVDSVVRSAVRSAVGSAVYSAVNSAVDSAVYSAVYSAVNSAVDSAIDSVINIKFWHYWLGGQFWAWWPSFTQFFFEEMGLNLAEINDKAFYYAETVKSAGYWWPNKDFIMVSDRPLELHRDEQGRLHNASGMALKYSDGWGLWMWHGVQVNEKLIMKPWELTKQEILAETNSEVSRAIAEKLGWDKYMGVLGTILVDKWFDVSKKLHYELYDFIDRPFELMPRLLKMESPEVKDGTRPYYIEPVHPELKTCQAARKWQMKIVGCPVCNKVVANPVMWRHGDVQISQQVKCANCDVICVSRWPEPGECNEDFELEFKVEA